MISYRDRAFCYRSAKNECISEICPRRVTDGDRKGANAMRLGFSLTDFKSDDCPYVENPAWTGLKEAVE